MPSLVLKENEEIKLILRRFGPTYAWKYILGLIFLAAPTIFVFKLLAWGYTGYVIFGLCWLIGFYIIIATWFFSRKNYMIATTERLVDIYRPGWFTEEVSAVSFDDVKDIFLRKQGLWATILNFGRLVVETKSEQVRLEFEGLYKPQNVVSFLMELKDEYRGQVKLGNPEEIYDNFLRLIPELSDEQLDEVQQLINEQFEEV